MELQPPDTLAEQILNCSQPRATSDERNPGHGVAAADL